MSDWFYEQQGQQQGPVSEAGLKRLFASGELGGRSLVWCQGMDDWASYASVFAAETSAAAELAPPLPTPRRQPVPGGICARAARAQARQALSGQWWSGVLVTFLNQFLQQVVVMIPLVGLIAPWLIAGPLLLGYNAFFVGLVRREVVEVSTLFNGFSRWAQGVGLFVVTTFIIVGSALLAAIPGGVLTALVIGQNQNNFEQSPLFLVAICAAVLPAVAVGSYFWLRYALVYFVANDEPQIGVIDALQRSSALMRGQKNRFCRLGLSFTGWILLGILTFGVGMLWAMTYLFAAMAVFYDDLIAED
jgi:uncharacterized membrane protein